MAATGWSRVFTLPFVPSIKSLLLLIFIWWYHTWTVIWYAKYIDYLKNLNEFCYLCWDPSKIKDWKLKKTRRSKESCYHGIFAKKKITALLLSIWLWLDKLVQALAFDPGRRFVSCPEKYSRSKNGLGRQWKIWCCVAVAHLWWTFARLRFRRIRGCSTCFQCWGIQFFLDLKLDNATMSQIFQGNQENKKIYFTCSTSFFVASSCNCNFFFFSSINSRSIRLISASSGLSTWTKHGDNSEKFESNLICKDLPRPAWWRLDSGGCCCRRRTSPPASSPWSASWRRWPSRPRRPCTRPPPGTVVSMCFAAWTRSSGLSRRPGGRLSWSSLAGCWWTASCTARDGSWLCCPGGTG